MYKLFRVVKYDLFELFVIFLDFDSILIILNCIDIGFNMFGEFEGVG